VTTATPGGSLTYTITASNAGPSNATGATVADTLPAALTGTWTCVGAGGGTAPPRSGNINDTVNLPAGGSVTYTVSATISASATGSLSNTATVTPMPFGGGGASCIPDAVRMHAWGCSGGCWPGGIARTPPHALIALERSRRVVMDRCWTRRADPACHPHGMTRNAQQPWGPGHRPASPSARRRA
jgi:uncharacterized repeat protein (TIGR01451 family)